jgi:hypothetical protein
MIYVLIDRGKHSHTLAETSSQEFKKAEATNVDGAYPYYLQLDPQQARRWVKDGGHHETPLYVDFDGRVRYARSGPC